MDQLEAMRVFIGVAEHLSFSAAAKQRGMSRPSVSRTISALEDTLGAQLLVRTTRTVSLTQIGARYLDDCRRIVEAVTEAQDAARGSHATPTGRLSITAPVLFGRLHMMPVVQSFLDVHPAVEASVQLLDRVINLVDEGLDVALRIGTLPDSGLHAVRVGQVTRVVVGAPSYLAEHGVPQSVADLAMQSVVVHTAQRWWRFRDGQQSVQPRVVVNDAQAAIELVERGFGLTQVLSYQTGTSVARGTLTRVLIDDEADALPVHLVFAGARRVPARTRAFIDHATVALRALAAQGWR